MTMMPIKNNEEEVQKALGTLPIYRVRIIGPRGGLLIRYTFIEALTSWNAIHIVCTGCSLGVRRRFFKVFQNTFTQSNCGIQRFVSAKVDLMNTAHEVLNSYKFNDLCQILTFDGELRDDISEDILENSVNN
jgi:hypothetical protein